jgi:hypothetical protein
MEKNEAYERTQNNFEMLPNRLQNLEEENVWSLKGIKKPCLCIGSGGSAAASYYASRILEISNGIIATNVYPRDILYKKNLQLYRNIVSITYSNNNHGINEAINYAQRQGLNSYILTANPETALNSTLITYSDTFEKEHSFISIASTFEPMEAMFKYYFGKFADEIIEEIYDQAVRQRIDLNFNGIFPLEIMSGDNTNTAATLLESTIVEAGLGIPVIHEKDNYRHGRSTLSYHLKNNILIYLLNGKNTELDDLLLAEASNSYRQVIILESKNTDEITGEFDLAIKAMFLCKLLAESLNKGLSKVEYNPIVRKLYKFNGNM